MADDPIKLEGLADLLHRLEKLPKEVAGKNGGPVRSAVRKQTKNQILRHYTSNIPKDTGFLADHVKMKIDPARARNKGIREGQNFEAYRVSIDVPRGDSSDPTGRPRKVTVKNPGSRGGKGRGGEVDTLAVRAWVTEFGGPRGAEGKYQRPQRWIRSGLNTTLTIAANGFKGMLKSDIDRVVKKLEREKAKGK